MNLLFKDAYSMITETENTINAYTSIGDFFDAFSLPDAAKYIRTSLLAANSKKIWNHHSYADLVFFYCCYKKLFSAAQTIINSGYQRNDAIISINENDSPAVISLRIGGKPGNKDQYFLHLPCHLSAKEFCNPYKAVKKAVQHLQQDKYDELFDILLQYALCEDSLVDIDVGWDTLQLNNRLQKLIEAAHLLYTRTVT